MFKKSSNKGLHIKRGTAGTSNEISFSILHAKSNALDNSQGRPSQRGLGQLELYTREGSTGGKSRDYSSAGIGSRSGGSARAKASVLSGGFSQKVAIAVVACFVVFGVVLFAQNAMKGFNEQVDIVHSAINEMSEVDVMLVAMDAVVEDPFEGATIQSIDNLLSQVNDTKQKLQHARSMAQSAVDNLNDSRERAMAAEVVNACDSRLIMLDEGAQILAVARKAVESGGYLADAWERVYEADSYIRQAAQMVSGNNGDPEASLELNDRAQRLLQDARYLVTRANQVYSTIDTEKQVTYLEAKMEAVEYAINSDQALIDGDLVTAEVQNEQYNQTDQRAINAALRLPSDDRQPAITAYETDVTDLYATYKTARYDAATSDAFLREYLGITAK